MMESHPVVTPTMSARSTGRRWRAIGTTIGIVLASYLLKFAVDMTIPILLPLTNSSSPFNGFGEQIAFFINDFLWPIAPAVLGGMYWLALRGLQRRRLRSVLVEVTGFGIIFFLTTSLLFTIINFVTIRFMYGINYFSDALLTYSLHIMLENPLPIALVCLLSCVFALVMTIMAQFFTIWPASTETTASKHRWRDIGIVWGLSTLIAGACQILFIFIVRYIEVPYSDQILSPYGLIRLISFFLPISIIAALACIDTLRALRHQPLVISPATPPVDPFASSDGSFTLSFGTINDDD